MDKMHAYRTVTLSEFDCARLRELLELERQCFAVQPGFIDDLERELARAKIVPPEQIPPYVVSMNTQFKLKEIDTGNDSYYTLVFPGESNLEDGRLSILSELGAAIIGHNVGDAIEYKCVDGLKRIRIDMICFQPEATKQFEL